jgi:hypothetical protein
MGMVLDQGQERKHRGEPLWGFSPHPLACGALFLYLCPERFRFAGYICSTVSSFDIFLDQNWDLKEMEKMQKHSAAILVFLQVGGIGFPPQSGCYYFTFQKASGSCFVYFIQSVCP